MLSLRYPLTLSHRTGARAKVLRGKTIPVDDGKCKLILHQWPVLPRTGDVLPISVVFSVYEDYWNTFFRPSVHRFSARTFLKHPAMADNFALILTFQSQHQALIFLPAVQAVFILLYFIVIIFGLTGIFILVILHGQTLSKLDNSKLGSTQQ